MEKVVFNHCYVLRHDKKRSYIVGRKEELLAKCKFDSNVISKIHPIYAMIFSFFSKPVDLSDAISRLSYFLDISEQETSEILKDFVDNEKGFSIEYDGVMNYIPANIIVSVSKSIGADRVYTPLDFRYKDLDFTQQRFYKAPLGLVYMVNNVCRTDCLYCYADKRVRRDVLPLEKIEDILIDARKSEVLELSVSGGEFFLYKNWRGLIELLIKYGYKPSLISTKIPLEEQEVLDFKQYDIPIQISLDSIHGNVLSKILNVSDKYVDGIKRTIRLLESNNVRYQIATVLTKYNGTLSEIQSLYDFILDLRCLSRWEIRTAFKSLYGKEHFEDIKIQKQSVALIDQWVKSLGSNVNILWVPANVNKYFKSDKGSRFFEGSRCSANYSHMVLLPDGKVTICEQLYWDQRFIIGDLTKQTISEVWNSEKALNLAHLGRLDFRNESACKECSLFDDCMSFPNRCIADILKAYGADNLDYPDPRCKKAPVFINEIV